MSRKIKLEKMASNEGKNCGLEVNNGIVNNYQFVVPNVIPSQDAGNSFSNVIHAPIQHNAYNQLPSMHMLEGITTSQHQFYVRQQEDFTKISCQLYSIGSSI